MSLAIFSITSAIDTGMPPGRLLSSAASMKAKISIVSSGKTGATRFKETNDLFDQVSVAALTFRTAKSSEPKQSLGVECVDCS